MTDSAVRYAPSYQELDEAARVGARVELDLFAERSTRDACDLHVVDESRLPEEARMVFERRRAEGVGVPTVGKPAAGFGLLMVDDDDGYDSHLELVIEIAFKSLFLPFMFVGWVCIGVFAYDSLATAVAVAAGSSVALALIGLTAGWLSDRRHRHLRLSYAGRAACLAATEVVLVGTPEHVLAAAATDSGTRIVDTEPFTRWGDQTPLHIRFDVAAETDEILRHAAAIARFRARIGSAPEGNSAAHRAAQTAIAENTQILDNLVESLRERVVALIAYRHSLDELVDRLAALRVIERQLAVTPDLVEHARQLGNDALATDRMEYRTAEARVLTEQVQQLIDVLAGTLAPRPARSGVDGLALDPAGAERKFHG